MFSRKLIVLSLSLGLFLATPAAIFAEDAALPLADNSKVSFSGVINSNDVYVRSGPGENYYATLKMDKGAAVTVVGLKVDWLKIAPPQGSFCYVAKAYVEKRGDGSIGRVTKPDLNVRAGSDLNAMKTTVQTKLNEGQDVAILGEQDEYFKIKPPEGAYLYVSKQLVDPVKQLPPIADAGNEPISSSPIEPMVSKTPDAPSTQPTAALAAAAPTTQGTANPQVAEAPATSQPAAPSAEAQFDAAETAFLDATSLSIEKQPIDDLLSQYQGLTRTGDLPVSMQRIVDMRVATLKLRADARNQYLDAQKMQDQARSRQTALKAEQEELSQRIKEQEVTVYAALGTLRTSSLQQGGQTLYRLTDPNTGRTLLYVRSGDPKYAGFLNQFIGVKGDVIEDSAMSIRVITPSDVDAVDQSKVNTTVTAQNHSADVAAQSSNSQRELISTPVR